ncbi:hypothetical protein [Parabacteroides sp. PF5-9]|uniref:hypothetical protein n=1 Tax=Parabacteroides sp. PF5-9 TaxID=1742404 RepID=UPI0024765068|nr:hypothetical protein [Parabacteroides sp. PF5-9]MDH6358946.1 hypothetical protein [Parabacteroides sp. PF5-9]
MLTKAELMERACIHIDLSIFTEEALQELNKLFDGKYEEQVKKTTEAIERGIDLYLDSVGKQVEVWKDGFKTIKTITGIDYDEKDNFYVIVYNDGGRLLFRNGAFSSFGVFGEYYGISTTPEKKSGIKFL